MTDVCRSSASTTARDLDNLLKPILDALTHFRLVEDDRHFDFISIRRDMVRAGGQIYCEIDSAESIEA